MTYNASNKKKEVETVFTNLLGESYPFIKTIKLGGLGSKRRMIIDGIPIDRIIEMAWEDRTTFEAIEYQFGLKEQEVIYLMRKQMKLKSFKMWRERVQGRKTKHEKLRGFAKGRFKCSRQKTISSNTISKR